MSESQNIEWKQAWHDDYLKWVCGFANAVGGTIYIGKNDAGEVVHLKNYAKLLEDIPNSIRNSMGIICDINLYDESGKKYIELKVNPYAVPISLRGRYYYRSGSTKMELTGVELNQFLLKKAGKTWDDVIEEGASLADIDTPSIQKFIDDGKAQGRLPDTSGLTTLQILNKLRLVEDEKLKRAALILFGKDPGHFFANVIVKIGRFGIDGSDLKFQEVLEGNLIYLLNEVLVQLNHKFLTRPVDFAGMHRIEKGEYPVSALREMLLNALVHKTYMGAAVQLRVFDHKLCIWNEGLLPQGLDIDSLKSNHNSRPRNPKIADACFKAGYSDSWGRGTLKILNACIEAELPEPEIIEKDGGVQVTIFKATSSIEAKNSGPTGGPMGGPIGGPMGGPIDNEGILQAAQLTIRQVEVLEIIRSNAKISRRKLAEQLEINVSAVQGHLDLLKEKGVLTRKGGTRGIWVILQNGDNQDSS
jgi:ATP-dependent DNA helicase RecG